MKYVAKAAIAFYVGTIVASVAMDRIEIAAIAAVGAGLWWALLMRMQDLDRRERRR